MAKKNQCCVFRPENRWIFWKILNKILKCKQVSASDTPKLVNCSRRFDEFCYCFCTSPATVDRPKGCVTCFRVGKKILWNKSSRCILTRKELQRGGKFFTHRVLRIWRREKLHFQMVSSGLVVVLPFWCCLRCCSGTHKDVAGGPKLEKLNLAGGPSFCFPSHILLPDQRLLSSHPILHVNPFGDYTMFEQKVQVDFGNWAQRSYSIEEQIDIFYCEKKRGRKASWIMTEIPLNSWHISRSHCSAVRKKIQEEAW